MEKIINAGNCDFLTPIPIIYFKTLEYGKIQKEAVAFMKK